MQNEYALMCLTIRFHELLTFKRRPAWTKLLTELRKTKGKTAI